MEINHLQNSPDDNRKLLLNVLFSVTIFVTDANVGEKREFFKYF